MYGLLAEFATGDDMVAATRKATAAGYTRMDGYSPYPVGDAADALGFPKSEMGAGHVHRRADRGVRRLPDAVLVQHLRVPAQRRRPAVL